MRASITQIRAFKACRRAWDLRYRERLYPVQVSDALETGKRYHELLADIENGTYDSYDDFSKENAMARSYANLISQEFNVTAVEKEFEKQIGNHTLHGFVDGLTDDGYIVEHKTTSRDISEGGEYEYNLLWDEQVLAYMSLTGMRKVYYTVCKKPTIRKKGGETDEDFFYRMLAWYEDDPDNRIRVFVVKRTDEEVAQFERDFVAICDEMERGTVYRNTCNCNVWGRRCEYSSVCLHYDPEQEYIEFERREKQ